jgi:hypothetical protein
MKHKIIELDVDFIGRAKPLTVKEEKELTEYFKKQNLKERNLLYQMIKKERVLQ